MIFPRLLVVCLLTPPPPLLVPPSHTRVLIMSQCSGSDSGSPPRPQISTQKTRNKESVRTLEDTVLWARNEGLGDHLRLANPQGETQAGKLFCWACAAWIVAKGCNLKDHVLGKNKRKADGTYERQPGGHARKLSSLPKEKEPAKPMFARKTLELPPNSAPGPMGQKAGTGRASGAVPESAQP